MFFSRLIKLLFLLRRSALCYYSTLIAILKFKIWGIVIDGKVRVFGSILLYREPGSKIIIGDNCCFNSSDYLNFRGINHRVIIQTGNKDAMIRIGDGCSFSGTSIVCDKQVILHNNVRVGANSSIADRDGHGASIKPVEIEDNVWLGMNVQVLKGVHIGANTIIGAMSVVTKDIPANCVAAGNPCKVIRQL